MRSTENEYTELGKIALDKIKYIEEKYCILFDTFVIMPNHIHAIIFLNSDNRKGCPYTLPQIVGGYKSAISHEWLKHCRQSNKETGEVRQRSYYDHIIRDEDDYLKICKHIDENPAKRSEDCYYKFNYQNT